MADRVEASPVPMVYMTVSASSTLLMLTLGMRAVSPGMTSE